MGREDSAATAEGGVGGVGDGVMHVAALEEEVRGHLFGVEVPGYRWVALAILTKKKRP